MVEDASMPGSNSIRIVKIEWGRLEGLRPRSAGCNARLGEHGAVVSVPILRLTASDGSSGFGICRAQSDQYTALLGAVLTDCFSPDGWIKEAWLPFEYPLWDLAGQRAVQPVYALAAAMLGLPIPAGLRVPCYDTSLYIDDLHLPTTEQAAQWMAAEARAGWAKGQRAFKLKIGRGARHMPLDKGTQRDIAVIRAVRAAVGPEAPLMVDANNGYNLNLAKTVLEETADCHLFWLEEPFHEDAVLYHELKKWMKEKGLAALIADGEGEASTNLLKWAEEGLVDVLQYDIVAHGFTRWLRTGQQLDAWGVRSAPHHYGTHYGNYAACHLAGLIQHFAFVEWDEASTPGLDGSSYAIQDGRVTVSNTPGFGLTLDEDTFQHAVAVSGGSLQG
jgi:L-rhamnonate dehydratase